jgi:hypothetical protein
MKTARQLFTALIFVGVCFALAALGSLIAVQYIADTFDSMYRHAAVGVLIGFALLANENTSFPIAYVVVTYQLLQSGDNSDALLNSQNAANLAGYFVGIVTVVLTRGALDFFFEKHSGEPAKRKPVIIP